MGISRRYACDIKFQFCLVSSVYTIVFDAIIRFLSMMTSCTLQALTFAKEALRLRAILFGEKFKFSVEQKPGNSNDIIDVIRKFTCSLQDLQVRRSVANELWSLDTISWDLDNCYLSPWIILQCYLESTLQVGVDRPFYD